MSHAFVKGTGQWAGVVMVSRPDRGEVQHCILFSTAPMCTVVSARLLQLGGRRAISERLPYATLKHLFSAEDGTDIFCEAEYKDGHLEFYSRSKSSFKDWVEHSYTPELLASQQ